MLAHQKPSQEEHAQLLSELGPLPLRGMAWPKWIKVLACVVLPFIGVLIARTAASPVGQNISPLVAGRIMVCFAGLVVPARHMRISVTNINEAGLQQSWQGRREVAREDLQSAKFISLVAHKSRLCFTPPDRQGVFQA